MNVPQLETVKIGRLFDPESLAAGQKHLEKAEEGATAAKEAKAKARPGDAATETAPAHK